MCASIDDDEPKSYQDAMDNYYLGRLVPWKKTKFGNLLTFH